MKKLFSVNNIIFLVAIIFLAYAMIPGMINNYSKEGQTIASDEYQVIDVKGLNRKIVFPSGNRTIAIFWATWCAPCKLEMARLSKSVDEGKIPLGAIVAINPFEDPGKVRVFLKENPYPFTFIEDDGISRTLNINKTPTTLFIENQKVQSLSSGLSLTGIWKAEQFLW